MKRFSEKVKDIVEVCPFTHLHDFAADPALTLAGYHFTDITAELAAKWIDQVAGIKKDQGAALALAGFRGVGKSHFLSVLAAIVSRPELRSRITDQHVASAAERLSRKRGTIAVVRRGSGTSLIDETKSAIAEAFNISPGALGDSLDDLLVTGRDGASETPLVIMIDTELGRDSRVARNDGVHLSEIAEKAKKLGIFVGVALDDDISGADGANSSIAGSFTIDYLDQEHLYKIVDAHIFSKHGQKLAVLHEIYESYRELLPGFRWSEHRFSSLYPLHPAILELAPLVRLYIPDFALLGFASEAGVKILGRPADSLIGLDEVFDSVEARLRNVPELKEAFAVFDKLLRGVVAATAVQFRLPAKLILKGFFLLSLNGQGATAAEIAASMMIFDEKGSGLDVEKLLDSFAAAIPESIDVNRREVLDALYCLRLASESEAGDVLDRAATAISDEAAWNWLLLHTAEKFSDLDAGFKTHSSGCNVEWRGAVRRGQIVWESAHLDGKEPLRDHEDWRVILKPAHGSIRNGSDTDIIWRLAELTTDEIDTVRKHFVLRTDSNVRSGIGESFATSLQTQSIAVEKIWRRVFLSDAAIVAGGLEYEFSETDLSAHNLSDLFTAALAPVFEAAFPSHPKFLRLLGSRQVSDLIVNFFAGSGVKTREIQELAETFAAPLGLASRDGEIYVPLDSDSLLNVETIKSIFGLTEKIKEDEAVPLEDLAEAMRSTPFGLTRESQQLVLAALVAQRRFEFVTTTGNRINHRSLDLQILWEDITGLAQPDAGRMSSERQITWAKLVTGNSTIRSLDRPEDRLSVTDSLSDWLADWNRENVLERFDALPDEHLNTYVWKIAANLHRSFEGLAANVKLLVEEEQSLEQCLNAIAESFSDSEPEFEAERKALEHLREYLDGLAERDEIVRFVSYCEITDDPDVENLRSRLLDLIEGRFSSFSANNGQIWASFKAQYTAYCSERHDAIMQRMASGKDLIPILQSEAWSAFQSFAMSPWFDSTLVSDARKVIRESRLPRCDVDFDAVSGPACSCSFSLVRSGGSSAEQLQRIVSDGLTAFRLRLADNKEKLMAAAAAIATGSNAEQPAATLRRILATIGAEPAARLNGFEILLLEKAVRNCDQATS